MKIYEMLLANALMGEGGGGGGGGGFPTATVTITAEKHYCECIFNSVDDNENSAVVLAVLSNNSQYLNYELWNESSFAQEVTAHIIMLADTFYLYPYFDGQNPSGITVTGNATWDSDNYRIVVSGDCSIHLVGFDE